MSALSEIESPIAVFGKRIVVMSRVGLLLVAGVSSYTLPALPARGVSRARPAVAALQPPERPPEPREEQKKPKSKQDRFELQFTCNMCVGRNVHSISRHAYSKGTVIVTCPSCNATHLVADNLNCACVLRVLRDPHAMLTVRVSWCACV